MNVNKVLYNIDQTGDTSSSQKETARKNIGATKVETSTSSLPPVNSDVSTLTIKDNGRIIGDSGTLGVIALEPGQSDIGKVLKAQWAGSPGIGTAIWDDQWPAGGAPGQALILDAQGNPVWAMPIQYSGGSGITETVDPHTGDIRFDWEYTVGRNLHINQNNAIQTNLPGGLYLAPTSYQNSFEVLSNDYGIAKFGGPFRLMCRKNSNDTYELAISYTASGISSRITFIGTETIVRTNNVITTNEAVYIGENSYYTPTNRFGGSASTPFDPSIHKAILYNGIANIGPTSDCKIAIWDDNGTVYVSFTAIEVSRVGSML